MGIKIINQWANGHEKEVEIDNFIGIDQSINASKLPLEKFPVLENWVKRKSGDILSLQKRNGIQRHNANQLSTANLINLFEARLDENYFLIGKDDEDKLKYCISDYSGVWTEISASEYPGFYRFLQFKNSVYICNRVNLTTLEVNKVWQGEDKYYDHGCKPSHIGDLLGQSDNSIGGLTPLKFYYYVITFLYDGYQESSATNWIVVYLTTAKTAIKLTDIPTGNERVKARKIYRSTGLDSGVLPSELYYVATINDNTTTSFVDTKADDALVNSFTPDVFFNDKKPYRAKHFCVSNGRLILGNLESPNKYTAIDPDLILFVPSNFIGGSMTSGGLYKYRISKAFASHSAGSEGWIIGDYFESAVIELGIFDTEVDFTIDEDVFSDSEYILIERTVAGGSEFFPIEIIKNAPSYNDLLSDAGATQNAGSFTLFRYENETETKYKSTIAISDNGKPDLFDAINVKIIEENSNQGITGMFTENDRVIIFTPTNIYALRTNAQSSEYWLSSKRISGIGAMGQDTAPKTETTGHSGILQLPNDSGYIFFNRAHAVTGQEVKIYYWNGSSAPEIISNQINSYINDGFSELNVTGMAFDRINNWVWIALKNSSNYVLVYDLGFSQWYIFTMNAAIELYDLVVTEDGKVIFSTAQGRLQIYKVNTYEDNSGATPTSYSFEARLQTKTFDEFNSEIVVKQIVVDCETSSIGIACQCGVGIDNTESPVTFENTATESYHRIRQRMNLRGKRAYFIFSNSENKNVLLQRIEITYKSRHQARGI